MTERQEPDHEGFEQRVRDLGAELKDLAEDANAAVDRQDLGARDALASRALAMVAKINAIVSEATDIEQWHLDQAAAIQNKRERFDAAADQLLKQAAMPSRPPGGKPE